MVLAFHQPNFLPGLGFFYKMAMADVFVIVSNVQFERTEGWQRRHKIKTAQGDLWLTVPVRGSQNQVIKEVTISSQVNWRHKHKRALELAYAKTENQGLLSKLLGIYEQNFERLVDLNMAIIECFRDELGIETRVVLDEEIKGKKEELIVNICRKYGAKAYLSGMGGKSYMTDIYFSALKKISVDYRFVEQDITGQYPYSAIHYLLAEGGEKTKRLMHNRVRLAAYQPQYFPRLHYFARMLDADVFALSDYVQFVRAHRYPLGEGEFKRGKSYQADTPIRSSNGLLHLTVPIKHGGSLPINETRISYDKRWQEKHLYSLKTNYGGARNFAKIFPLLSQVLAYQYADLAQLNTATILLGLRWLLDNREFGPAQLTVPAVNKLLERVRYFPLRKIVIKSQTNIAPPNGNATEWIIDSCQKLGANEYVCGGTAVETYLDRALFDEAGISLRQQDWSGAPYNQLFPKQGFMPNLSVLDLMMNVDKKQAREILAG